MPSSYTQNLGIEQPATGEQAGTWGVTANTSYATIDTAICGSIQIPLSASTYVLNTSQGGAAQNGVYPLILWTGSLSGPSQVSIAPNTAQKRYTMVNNTSGGQVIAFSQGSGAQFTLQNGYGARIYSDGAGPGAGVFAELANPQFNNVLAAGTLQVNGGIQGNLALNSGSLSVAGNLSLAGSLGVGGATSLPSIVTITGGSNQLRVIGGGYGVVFDNDGTSFFLLVTAANDPYGNSWTTPYAMQVNLATKTVGIGWPPNASYALNTPSIHASSIALDTTVSAGASISAASTITAGAGFTSNSGRNYFINPEPFAICLEYAPATPAVPVTYIGTNPSGQFQVSNQSGGWLLLIDQSGNASIASNLNVAGGLSAGSLSTGGSLTASGTLTAGGVIHSQSGGFQFPDNTVQTTAATGLVAIPHGNTGKYTQTPYQNTTGKTMFVSVGTQVYGTSGGQFQAYVSIDNTTPRSNMVAEALLFSPGQFTVFFIVPPGWFYQVNLFIPAATTQQTDVWTEYY